MSASSEGSAFARSWCALAALSIAAFLALVFSPQRAQAGDGADAVQTSLAAAKSPLDLAIGRALFERAWVSAPASTKSTDGLGPFYNARSCAACHTADRRPVADASGQAVPSASRPCSSRRRRDCE